MSRKVTINTYRRNLKERQGRADLLTNYVYQTTLKRYAELVDLIETTTDEAQRVTICQAADKTLNNLLAIEQRG